MTWGSNVGTQLVGTLKLGSITSTSSVTFLNPIDLGGGARTLAGGRQSELDRRLRGAVGGDQRLGRRRLVD